MISDVKLRGSAICTEYLSCVIPKNCSCDRNARVPPLQFGLMVEVSTLLKLRACGAVDCCCVLLEIVLEPVVVDVVKPEIVPEPVVVDVVKPIWNLTLHLKQAVRWYWGTIGMFQRKYTVW